MSNSFGIIYRQVNIYNHSVQSISVAQLCPALCEPPNRSTPGLPVHHKLPEFTQTHAHRVGDAIEPYLLKKSWQWNQNVGYFIFLLVHEPKHTIDKLKIWNVLEVGLGAQEYLDASDV